MIVIVAVVCTVAGICVGVMVGGYVAGAARPCPGCNEPEVPYKLDREVLGQ